jgi:hypothetical protein
MSGENDLSTNISMPGIASVPSREYYITRALDNLKNTSRTARGVIDTSASVGKAAVVQTGMSQSETASLAETNFRQTVEHLYDNRAKLFSSPGELQRFIEDTAVRVNRGITRDGVLYRQDDSNKFPYTRIKDLEGAKNNFYEEFFGKLIHSDTDPVETAGWVEYRTNFTDHFFADGCGKISKAVGYWVLMRSGKELPKYRGEKELYGYTPKKVRGEDTDYDSAHYKSFIEYYRSLFED